jgi:O-antigen/teichoic acid export membrane protein
MAMGLHRIVPAGLIDVGCASLATFGVGLYAVRVFPPATLGVYSLFLAAFLAAAIVPAELLFVPAEIAALPYRGARRLRLLAQSLRIAWLPALLAAILASCLATAGAIGAAPGAVESLAWTAAICTFLSPLQDHVRRLMHLAGRSWRAAAISVIQLATVGVALLLSAPLHIPATLVPFGGLALANGVSLSIGLLLAREGRAFPALERLSVRGILRSGRWLMLLRLIPALAGFVSGVLVAHLANAATLGHVEAARVAAQPVIVLATGLSAVFGPRLMESGANRRLDLARPVSRTFQLLVLALGLLYFASAGFPWRPNPLPEIMPKAYAVTGLLPLMIAAQLLDGLPTPYRSELVGAGQGRAMVFLEGPASALQCLVSASAGLTGAFAKPLGMLTQSAVAYSLLRSARNRLYAGARTTRSAGRAGR